MAFSMKYPSFFYDIAMDLLQSGSEQASDKSLFSESTDPTSESQSINSQAEAVSTAESVSAPAQNKGDSECSEVVPETQESALDEETVPSGSDAQPQSSHGAASTSIIQESGAFGSEEKTPETCAEEYTKADQSPTTADASTLSAHEPAVDALPQTGLPAGDGASGQDVLEARDSLEDDSVRADRKKKVSNRLIDSDDEDGSSGKSKSNDGNPVESAAETKKDEDVFSSAVRRLCYSSDEDDSDVAGDNDSASGHRSGGDPDSPRASPKKPSSDGGASGDSDDEGASGAQSEADAESTAKKKDRGPARKSAKKAMEELREIYSTSQRMAREREMSLPYHEPERLSLKAFLQQRRSGTSQPYPECKKEEETRDPPLATSDSPAAALSSSSMNQPNDEVPTTSSAAPADSEVRKDIDVPVSFSATSPQKPCPEDKPCDENKSPQSSANEKVDVPLLSARRRRALAALASNTVPCLSKDPVILLADEGDDQPKGVDSLLKRLVKHSKVDEARIKKETIKTNAIVVPGVIEGCTVPEKGVSRLTVLKEKLLEKVRQQRNRSREQRYLQRCLDNEEIPSGAGNLDNPPKSPLSLLDDFDEEEEEEEEDGEEERGKKNKDAPDASEASSGDEEDDGDSSDEELVLRLKKRKVKKVNPLSDDEDEDGAGDEEPRAEKAGDEEEDSDAELHLEMPPFLGIEDDADQPATEDEPCVEGLADTPLTANKEKTVETPQSHKSSRLRTFQSDEVELFSPLTGLPRTQSKTDTPRRGSASASSSFQESPLCSTVSSRTPSLAFSPLAPPSGSLTACRSLRRQFSEDIPKPWEDTPPNPSQDMEELVGLCSGSFAARQANEAEQDQDGDDDGDDDDDLPEAGHNELNDDEEQEDDDVVEASHAEPNEDDEVDNSSGDELSIVAKKSNRLQEFFEDEAELSGSDVGSDGEEDAEDDEGVLADLIAAEDEKEDTNKVREEIGRFHFKQLLDEDKRELKIYQELLLEDGDLHTDGAGRQRQFRWRNSASIKVEDHLPGSDGEEEAPNEADQEVDASWRLQRLERQRWLQEQESAQRADSPDNASFSEQDSLLRAPTVIAKQDTRFSKKSASKKGAMCGSFLKLDSGVLGRIAERIKVAAPTEKEGSLTTKNFVFRAAEEKPKKRPSKVQPVQEAKKPKLEDLTEQNDVKISVFNFM
ncbi:claspin isoform X2 [Haemaphysalis longicornis]